MLIHLRYSVSSGAVKLINFSCIFSRNCITRAWKTQISESSQNKNQWLQRKFYVKVYVIWLLYALKFWMDWPSKQNKLPARSFRNMISTLCECLASICQESRTVHCLLYPAGSVERAFDFFFSLYSQYSLTFFSHPRESLRILSCENLAVHQDITPWLMMISVIQDNRQCLLEMLCSELNAWNNNLMCQSS